MTGGAHLRILPFETGTIEPGAVRVEAAAALGGVAGEAISLGMTADARLQALSRGLTVTGQEELFAIVKPGAQGSLRHQPRLLVTGGAEPRGTMTICARRFPGVGGRGMPGQEPHRMISSR